MTDTDLMPFGKYKGTAMANVPADYLLWLYRNTAGAFRSYPEVKEYIRENLKVLEKELLD